MMPTMLKRLRGMIVLPSRGRRHVQTQIPEARPVRHIHQVLSQLCALPVEIIEHIVARLELADL
jgi:hypothetical protein